MSGLNNVIQDSSTVEVEMQLKSALNAAGCSKDAVDLLKFSAGKACIAVFQASVSYQQFILNIIYAVEKMKVYTDYSCFLGKSSYIRELKCYLDNLNKNMIINEVPSFFSQVKSLVDEVNKIVDLYKDSYKNCLDEQTSLTYEIGTEQYSSLESLVQSHCPAGTSVEKLRNNQN
uniref:Salivap-6 n=1 Tax=Nilaparvata lugens TaxID=108931 RepID=A0A191UR84_NILLU|nr:salivap-6 [Nilaparvata lugens]